MPYTELIPWTYGTFCALRQDKFITPALRAYGVFSPGEVAVFEALVGPQDVVIEVGANVGVHTVPLALRAGAVIAIEPQRLVYQVLCANVALAGLQNVHCIQAVARSSTQGITAVPLLDVDTPQSFGSLSLLHQIPGASEQVTNITVDSLQAPCSFLKIDCEGMEYEVLHGAIDTLRRHRPFVYLEYAENRVWIRTLLLSLGYTCYRHQPWMSPTQATPTNRGFASDMLLAAPQPLEPPLLTQLALEPASTEAILLE